MILMIPNRNSLRHIPGSQSLARRQSESVMIAFKAYSLKKDFWKLWEVCRIIALWALFAGFRGLLLRTLGSRPSAKETWRSRDSALPPDIF